VFKTFNHRKIVTLQVTVVNSKSIQSQDCVKVEFLRSGRPLNPRTPAETFQRRRAFGTKLYEKLFSPGVANTWQAYKDKSDFLVLCLRIARAAEKLEVLPWEILYDGTEFIADLEFFKNFRIDNGVLTWGSGEIDIAPETLYHKATGEPYPQWMETSM